MRKLLPLFAAVLAACSSSDSGPSYAVSDSAVAFDSAAGCALDASTTVGVSIAVVNLTDYTTPTACASMQGNTVAANGAAAGLLLVRADFTTSGGPAPGLAQETYPYFDIATLAPPASKIPRSTPPARQPSSPGPWSSARARPVRRSTAARSR